MVGAAARGPGERDVPRRPFASYPVARMRDERSEHLATAHQEWDKRWQIPEQRTRWLEPDPLVRSLVPLLRARGFARVLDLGCGIGRHAIYLASEGFLSVG